MTNPEKTKKHLSGMQYKYRDLFNLNIISTPYVVQWFELTPVPMSVLRFVLENGSWYQRR